MEVLSHQMSPPEVHCLRYVLKVRAHDALAIWCLCIGNRILLHF